jgi:CO dehydrogenase nickel-insertion accessory protein CooC1
VRDFIDQVEGQLPDTVVVADMEAGLEHLSIGTLRYIDMLLVVVQPTAKTMMTADRTSKLARELGIPEVAFVGNRVRRPAEEEQLRAFAADHGSELLVTIGEDDNVRWADAQSRCILDLAPDSEMVHGVGRLATQLERRYLTTPAAR